MLDAIIVGAGPVGLYLAHCLQQANWEIKVLEKEPEPPPDSRAVGIHSGALDCLERIGFAAPLLLQAIHVQQAKVFWDGKLAGDLDLSASAPPHSLVAMHPQSETVALLDDWLACVERGTEVTSCTQMDEHVEVTAGDTTWQARWLIAADGFYSPLREQAGIAFPGETYPDVYAMGDFAESTDFGTTATVYLGPEGLVESFPLPGDVRRWVLKTETYLESPTVDALAIAIENRTGHELDPGSCTMLSSFRTHGRIAERFQKGRLLLVGDAAHTVSPIGGQGMNLGWINAERLATALTAGDDLVAWEAEAQATARIVKQRGEFNTRLGRAGGWGWWRRLVLWGVLHPPLRNRFVRSFTMRDL